MATELDRQEIIETALLVLSRVEPEMAVAVWLQVVEEFSLEDIAARLECNERTVRRWLDGAPVPGAQNRVGVLGGKALIRIIVGLLEAAHACGTFQALVYALNLASGRNAWGTPFTAALLERLRTAQARQSLAQVLARLNAAYHEQRFMQFIQDLLLEEDVRFE